MGSEKIAFPGLGLEFNIDPVAFTIFGKEIFWYGIIISLALVINIIWAMRDVDRFGIKSDDFIDFIFLAIPAAVIGARLYYVIFKWQEYSANPLEVLQIWKGGLAIYGAVIAGVITAWIFAKVKGINPLALFDFCAPFLAFGQSIGRWGNFVNREAYGSITNLPWRMEIPALDGVKMIAVHPTFLYESLWNLLIFVFLMFYRNRSKRKGEVFFLYLILYGLGRFWIEGLRADSLMVGNLKVSQILSIILVVVFAIVIYIRRTARQDISMTKDDSI
ncbi:MAG: prolipoprotein diacylglyceryl transferase [Ignavibacteriales bacterium]